MKDKVMLITGAYRGIGKAIALYFANLGVNIIMTYHEKRQETFDLEKELQEKYHVHVESNYLDLSSEKSIQDLAQDISKKYGKIDYLVNNAAISLDNDIFSKTKDEFMQVLEVNVVGTFLMMQYFDHLVSGFIFNISSTDGIDTGNIYSIDYNASKAALNNMTKTFSLKSKNKIISICPNWVDTESTKNMDQDYLNSELRRVGQERLINVNTVPKVINDCISNNEISGSLIRIEGDEDVTRLS